MSVVEDLQFLLEEQRIKNEKIKEILDRFNIFGTYTIRDYENAMGDIREVVG